jgi:hypothetical protein
MTHFPNMSTEEAQRLSCSCLCGASTFTLANTPLRLILCHCVNCQKWSGTAFAANIWFPASALTLTNTSTAKIIKYADSNTDSGETLNRHFCGGCGASLYLTVPHHPEIVSVMRASIDGFDGGGLKPHWELYTKDRWEWVRCEGVVERFESGPG